ncbi:MAG TPA: winged helix-turn-helix domain-containing protein [Bacillota bacterium]|nr:winged helix-turn-helix domain-containing protein [Bacillota bacterium]HNT04387.1 winged helix-turn-helix domain-containing protein [Bacillota bacterium]HPX69578.1 winged helix-turn-helix domain-containing protein [Bacillota bacterium]HQA66521.1 winged helix-turn-helix domain-containing protein [Bacillota bacterium]
MAMEIYGESDEPLVRIVNSPVVELICAVHLLTDAAHHQYELRWAEEVLSGFKQEELEALNTIKLFSSGWMNMLNLILESGILTSIPEFIGYIERLDLLDFFYFFLNEEVERTKIQKAFAYKKERSRIQEKTKWAVEESELMEFFEFPEKIKRDTINLFKKVYAHDFMAKLDRCKEKMEAGIQYVESFTGKDSVESVLEKISGRSRKLFSGFKEYYIIPSYFISPQKSLRIYSGDRIYVVFDCRVTRDKREALLEELSSVLKIIDDKSRMEILRILMNNKSYGKALSDLVGLSTPTVSHHLDILKQAGLIKEEKIRNIKYFYADKDKLKKVVDDINKYFFGAE